MRIESRDGDAWHSAATLLEKIVQQGANAHDLFPRHELGDPAQWNVTGDEGDGELSSRQAHAEILDPAATREEFRLAGKTKPNVIHIRLVNWAGHHRCNGTGARELDGFIERRRSSPRRMHVRLSRNAVRILPDDLIFKIPRAGGRLQRGFNNLRPDSRRISQRDADRLQR